MNTTQIICEISDRLERINSILLFMDDPSSLSKEDQTALHKSISFCFLGINALEHMANGTSPKQVNKFNRAFAKQVLKSPVIPVIKDYCNNSISHLKTA